MEALELYQMVQEMMTEEEEEVQDLYGLQEQPQAYQVDTQYHHHII